MYVPPETPAAKPFDPTNPEFVASVREFMGPTMRTPGEEGFTINGSKVK
jgi:hypothetical protein